MTHSRYKFIGCTLLFIAALAAVISVADGAPPTKPFQGASWVWNDSIAGQNDLGNEPRYLRRSFALSAKPTAAELKITADNNYTVFINGEKIGEDGLWNSVETYDVAKHLRQGSNVLAIVASNAGGAAGVIAWLRVITEDKQETVVATDSSMRLSLVATDGWLKADFDDSKWAKVAVLGSASMGPWNILGDSNSARPSQPGTSSVADRSIQTRLSPQDEQPHFLLPEGFEIELVAAEPLVINPISMTVDERGRIYVSESHTYRYGPSGSPIKPFKNPLVRLDPLPGGKGYRRVLVADGFDEPIMGLAVRGNKLWCTACNFLYQFDLQDDGQAVNRRTLLIDKNKAWNPFGMFVLEWGPDGQLYMSVGNHNIDIRPPAEDGKPAEAPSISGRGGSGIVMRINADGGNMQRLVHGLRVPYSFEYDPFGQLWVLSNGEGNPNRFVRVIDGVDYHCYSRGVSNQWLTGQHLLSPPCFELPAGAHTQLMRYYGAAYPAEYQGNLFLDNWGQHGFAGANRSVFRYTTDERNEIVSKEAFVSCADPHFRCSHIALDNDGNMLVADWYGRDDESDLTGRIWRVKYTGELPMPQPSRSGLQARPDGSGEPSYNLRSDDDAVAALGSSHHRVRERAVEQLRARGNEVVGKLSAYAAAAEQPLGAASALWTLLQIGTPQSHAAIASGAKHSDWRVRRLAMNFLRRYDVPAATTVATALSADKDPAVQVEAALAHKDSAKTRAALLAALQAGAADDLHLRYEAAWHLARHAESVTFDQLLNADDVSLRLTGLIALDIALYESRDGLPNGPDVKSFALQTLTKRLADPGPLDAELLLDIVSTNPNPATVDGLRQLIARPDAPVAIKARGLLTLRALSGGVSDELLLAAGKHLLEAAEKGEVQLHSNADWLLLLKLMEAGEPSDFTVRQIASLSGHGDAPVRAAALSLARKFGPAAAPITGTLWQRLLDPKHPVDRRLEIIGTLTAIEPEPNAEHWQRLLADPNSAIRADAIRSWRAFAENSALVEILLRESPALIQQDPEVKGDLAAVLRHLKTGEAIARNLPQPETDKQKLAEETTAAIESMSPDRSKTAHLLGRRVFERSACVKCHTTVSENTPRAPSLKDIGKTQKLDYLIESVLDPSKIIKTGFLSETIITTDGQTLSGLVQEEGDSLRIFDADRETLLPKSKIDQRAVVKKSLMPDGQEQQLSREEFADLIAYLQSLK
jgi:putative membrane-bound dehydrogenase-like protein